MPRKQGDVEKSLLAKGFRAREGDHCYFNYYSKAGKKTAVFIVFPIDIRTLNIKPILELPHIAYQEDEKTTGLFRFFPAKT